MVVGTLTRAMVVPHRHVLWTTGYEYILMTSLSNKDVYTADRHSCLSIEPSLRAVVAARARSDICHAQ